MESLSNTWILMRFCERYILSSYQATIVTESCQSLDGLLTGHVSTQIAKRLQQMSNLSQIAQIVVNVEHFSTACDDLEGVLMNLR